PGCAQSALRRIQVTGLAEQEAQADQHGCRDAVTRRDGLVGEAFAAVNELFVILGREEKSTVGFIFELIQQHLGQLARKIEIAAAPAGLQYLEQRVGEEGVVIEI